MNDEHKTLIVRLIPSIKLEVLDKVARIVESVQQNSYWFNKPVGINELEFLADHIEKFCEDRKNIKVKDE